MAEEAPKQNDETPKKELSPYDKMSGELRLKWEERLFNTLKLRDALLDMDSILTYSYILWSRFVMVVAILLAINPTRFAWRTNFCFALGASIIYYVAIGFVRRQTERNLIALCAQHSDPAACMGGKLFAGRKPYNEANDPPLARRFFRLRSKLGIPRRGAAQKEVLLWQFVVGLCYMFNYSWYVLWQGNISGESDLSLLWMLHVTMTAGGILVLFKNAGFLVDTNRLIKTIESLAGTILGHAHASVTVEKNGQKPCDDKNECSDKK